MHKWQALMVSALLASPLAGFAQGGGYIVGGGLGATECAGFIESMGQAHSQKPGSAGYAGDVQGFSMYVSGFQTAYNLQTPETCDIFSGWNNAQVLDWVEKFCRAHPGERFGAGVIALAKERYPTRARKCG